MKIILLIIFIVLLPSFTLASETKNNTTIADILTKKVISGKGYKPYTSALLLTHLRISDKNEKSLIELYNKENNLTKKLFIANIFVKRIIGQYEKEFIRLFLEINNKSSIINITYNTEYVHIISPLYDTLISLSYNDEDALSILLNTLKDVQGGYSEILHDTINEIYKLNPKYVTNVANKNNINLKNFLIQ